MGAGVSASGHPKWTALEDKLLADDLWAEAGLRVAPSAAVDLDDFEAGTAARQRLQTALGTVWAADNANGIHGGASGTRWLGRDENTEALMREFSLLGHRRARVMGFVDGLPCSIHAMVLERGIAVFRPMELLILRDEVKQRLVYAKASGHWLPDELDRIEMENAAYSVAEVLRKRVGYRGVFTLDGIMSADGFIPTELNPRFGGAMPAILPTADGGKLSLLLVHHAVIEGRLANLDPARLQQWVRTALALRPITRAFINTPVGPQPEQEHELAVLRQADGILRLTPNPVDQPPLATIDWGKSGGGGLAMVKSADGFPVGPSAAPLLLEIRAVFQAELGLDLDRMTSAPDIRRDLNHSPAT